MLTVAVSSLRVFHMFRYLQKKHNAVQVFNPNEPSIDINDFPKLDWSNTVYANERGELFEDVPKDLPKPFGKEFKITICKLGKELKIARFVSGKLPLQPGGP